MPIEKITLEANGREYEGWERITIRAALNEAARSFEIEVSEVIEDGKMSDWIFPPNTAVNVKASGSLMLSGYVDDYEPEIDGTSHRVTIRGRSRGADYADTSVVHDGGHFEDKKLEDIAQELDVCGVGIECDVDTGAPIKQFRVRQGESPHAEVLRLCQQRKCVMKAKPDGGIVITQTAKKRHRGGLAQGVNLKRMSAQLSAREKFSDYVVKGQSADMWDDASIRPRGKANDGTVKRYRPKVIIDRAATNPDLCEQRAEWERSRAAGVSAKATLITAGFRDDGGALWEPGWTVFTKAPALRIEQDMLIESVEFTQSNEDGTEATIQVVDPRTYAAEKASASDNDAMWDLDEKPNPKATAKSGKGPKDNAAMWDGS